MSDGPASIRSNPPTRECRVAVRHRVHRDVFLQRGHGRADQFWRFAKMIDLSQGGVRLVMNRGFPAETELLIEISSADAAFCRTTEARVVHSTEEASGWIIGCAFQEALSEADLKLLL